MCRSKSACSIETKHCQEILQFKVIGVDCKKDKKSLVHVMKYKNNGDPALYRTTQDELTSLLLVKVGCFREITREVLIENGTRSNMASAKLNVLTEYDSIESLEAIFLDNKISEIV